MRALAFLTALAISLLMWVGLIDLGGHAVAWTREALRAWGL